ncbi:metallophosphoesterase, partial [Candidatus Pacearchaeota archaeon]|nr:metallophosphoesterase [Candidatus Pacearchaeota archaeon]
MKIASGAEIIGKALFFPEKRILSIADLHIGYEGMLNEKGVLVPRTQFKEMMDDLKKVFEEIEKSNRKIKEVIILGDLKHDFGGISRQEWKETLSLLDFLKKHAEKIILIRGNHDTILEPISRQRSIELKDFYIKENICFMHGHKMFAECLGRGIKTIVLGHKHPALVLQDKSKSEKY